MSLRLKPGNGWAHFTRAQVYKALGQSDLIRNELSQADSFGVAPAWENELASMQVEFCK